MSEATSPAAIELPKYQCHKQVWALKIKSVERTPPFHESGPKWIITPEDPAYAPFDVSVDYYYKHDPRPGGYWVKYVDGYQSFSPQEAFENWYTRI